MTNPELMLHNSNQSSLSNKDAMIYSKDKSINTTVRCLLRAGWSVKSRKRHLTITDGRYTVSVPTSPSDHRTALNWHSQIQRTTGVNLAALGC
jgi:hypothetical protein